MGSLWKILVLVAVANFFSASGVFSHYDGDALSAFKENLIDPDNTLQSWDPDVDTCTWFHVTCDQNNHVKRVDLGNADLSGSLGPELGTLEHLQYLELYTNDITGNIRVSQRFPLSETTRKSWIHAHNFS